MQLMVCGCTPYLRALEGLRHVLQEIYVWSIPCETQAEYMAAHEQKEKIDIPGLEPVYDESSLEHKLRRMNSGRKFIGHVSSFTKLTKARFEKKGWNLFIINYLGHKILVGSLGLQKPIVVAFQGPAENNFIGMMEERQRDFQDINTITIEDLYPGDPHAAEFRECLQTIRNLMAAA